MQWAQKNPKTNIFQENQEVFFYLVGRLTDQFLITALIANGSKRALQMNSEPENFLTLDIFGHFGNASHIWTYLTSLTHLDIFENDK